MMYENYGLGIFGHAHSVKLTTDGEICFYFTDKDSRDRALSRIRSVLKIEGNLPVSELCKYHKLLSAYKHDSDRGWTREDLDESRITGYDLSVNTYEIAFQTPRNFESPEETKETTTDGDLGVFRNAFSFEETSDKGLKFSFKSRDDRDKAYEAFKNCLLSKKQITTSDLEMCLLNFSNDWAVFVMMLFAIWPSDLGWERKDLARVVCGVCYRADNNSSYDLFLPAPRKLKPKDENTDKSDGRSCRRKYTDCLFPGLKKVFKVEEKHGRIDLTELYFHHAELRDTAYEEIKTVIETKGCIWLIDVLNSLSESVHPVKSDITIDDMQLGWTPEDLNRFGCSDYGWSTGVMGETEHVLYIPAPHIISRSDMDTEYPLYPFKKAIKVHDRWNAINDSIDIAIDFCTEEDRDHAAEGFKKLISPDNGFVTAGNLRSFLPKNLGDNDNLKCHSLMGLSWDHRHLNEIFCYTYMCGAEWRYAVALPSLTEEDGGD